MDVVPKTADIDVEIGARRGAEGERTQQTHSGRATIPRHHRFVFSRETVVFFCVRFLSLVMLPWPETLDGRFKIEKEALINAA